MEMMYQNLLISREYRGVLVGHHHFVQRAGKQLHSTLAKYLPIRIFYIPGQGNGDQTDTEKVITYLGHCEILIKI